MRKLWILGILILLGGAAHASDRLSGGGGGGGTGTDGATGPAGPSNKCYGGMAASLTSAGTDYSTVEATCALTGILPYYVRAFDGSTTEYMRGSLMLEPNLKLLSNVTFYASIRPKTAAASKNVQLTFLSTAASNNGSVTNFTISTAADIVPLSAVMYQWTIFSWAQTVANLGWAPSLDVDFGFSRSHDTSKLIGTELVGDLYWKDWKICVDLQ